MQQQFSDSVYSLGSEEIHVWFTKITPFIPQFSRLQNWLSADEKERAARFLFVQDAQRYMIIRALLRGLLGCYLDEVPQALAFEYNPYGKPSLCFPDSSTAIQFNLSHARDVAVFAFTTRQTVGIDVEWIDGQSVDTLLTQSILSAREMSEFLSLPHSVWVEAFFNAWTRKEAFIKALGKGFSYPAADVEVNFIPDQPAHLIHWKHDIAPLVEPSLMTFRPFEDYVAAVVASGGEYSLQVRSLRLELP